MGHAVMTKKTYECQRALALTSFFNKNSEKFIADIRRSRHESLLCEGDRFELNLYPHEIKLPKPEEDAFSVIKEFLNKVRGNGIDFADVTISKETSSYSGSSMTIFSFYHEPLRKPRWFEFYAPKPIDL